MLRTVVPLVIVAAVLASPPAVASPFSHTPHRPDTSAIFAPVLEKANAGDAPAQYAVGMRYERGQDVKQSFAEASKWFQKAADQGVTLAQLRLGEHYQYGRGVPLNLAEATKWYRKAAEQDNFAAQHALGKLYLSGDGVKQDFAEGYFWLSLAAADKQYAADRDRSAPLLKADQLAAVKARVEQWRQERSRNAGQDNKEKKG